MLSRLTIEQFSGSSHPLFGLPENGSPFPSKKLLRTCVDLVPKYEVSRSS